MVWDCLIVGLLWLHHIEPLANATMETIAIGKVGKLVLPITSCHIILTLLLAYFLSILFSSQMQMPLFLLRVTLILGNI
jgi:F0F1-type ATP synthase assembly protein I